MVRNYVRKSQRGSYSKAVLDNAVEEVKMGVRTLSNAAKTYSIPKSTLCEHIGGKYGVKSKTLGRCTVIPAHLEKSLADCKKP